MEVFLISHASYADLQGEGGVYNKGRWHNKGHRIVYTNSSRSLSMLERYIHEDGQAPCPRLIMMAIHIPDKLEMETITTHQLTESWFSYDDISQDLTRKLGEDWLLKQRTAVLKVPSAIVPQEFNYLINPMARDAADIKIIDIREYHYENRYKGLLTTRTP